MGQNIGTFAVILLLITIMVLGLNQVGEDITEPSNLDTRSQQLILEISYEKTNNYNEDNFEESQSNVIENSTFEGVDAFARQFLEDKSETLQRKSTIQKIITAPDLVIKLIGVEDASLIIALRILIDGVILFFLGLVIYKAVKTGEVDG